MVRGFGCALFLISGTFRNYNYRKNETLKDLNFAKNCGILVLQHIVNKIYVLTRYALVKKRTSGSLYLCEYKQCVATLEP